MPPALSLTQISLLLTAPARSEQSHIFAFPSVHVHSPTLVGFSRYQVRSSIYGSKSLSLRVFPELPHIILSQTPLLTLVSPTKLPELAAEYSGD